MTRLCQLCLVLFLGSIFPIYSGTLNVGVRGFLRDCARMLLQPSLVTNSIDFRNTFISELDALLENYHAIRVLSLGAEKFHPWTLAMTDKMKEVEGKDEAGVGLFSVQGDKIILDRVSGRKKPQDKGFHYIYDAAKGPASGLAGLNKTLQFASQNLVEGGLLAISFPNIKNPLESTPSEFGSKIAQSLNGQLLPVHLNARYKFLKRNNYLSAPDRTEYVRLDGVYVKKKDGTFVTLLSWIDEALPDFELIKPTLESVGLGGVDPLLHLTQSMHFNQIFLRKRSNASATPKQTNKSLKYVGTTGKQNPEYAVALPYHFFDEVE